MKFADFQTTSDAFATTWAAMDPAISSISGVAQGDGESERDGRIFMIHSIMIRCHVAATTLEAQATPFEDLRGRICLVLDTQTNGAQLTATDVMDGGQTDDTQAFRNLQHTKRFRILWDKKWHLRRIGQTNEGAVDSFAAPTSTTPQYVYYKRFKKPIKVICTGTTTAITAISDNSLHIIGVANSVLALHNMQVRIRFTG